MQILDEIKHYHEMTHMLNGRGGVDGIRNGNTISKDPENNLYQSLGKGRTRIENSINLTDEQK